MTHSVFTFKPSAGYLGQYSRKLFCGALVALAINCTVFVPAIAQTQTNQLANRQFDVPAGSLASALLRFGEQSGLQFSVSSTLTKGKKTTGIKGKYTPEEGLRALLSGTGLTFRFTGPRTVVIEMAPDTADARVLSPLRVEGADSGKSTAGVNGSTDGTATENSGTYGASATSLVSKSLQSSLDTPQSVSVLTRQQLSDQRLNDFKSAVGQLPGVTLKPGDSNQTFQLISRGFDVTSFRVDGGSPIDMSRNFVGDGYDYGFRPTFDLAMYDHIEVLRGADGMYSGYGSPGGVVNLVRKRPLDHQQVLVEAELGSWNNYRTMLDVTGPVGLDGRLRGRAVFTYQDKDYFYDRAYDTHSSAFGVIEADLTDKFVGRAGVNFTKRSSVPWTEGLPRYENGDDLGLPRNTCLCLPDAIDEVTNREFYLQGEYAFNRDWSLDTKLTYFDETVHTYNSRAYNAVNPDTGKGHYTFQGNWNDMHNDATRLSVDSNLKGAFDVFGKRQEITVGFNYSDNQSDRRIERSLAYGTAEFVGLVSGIPGFGEYNEPDIRTLDINDFRLKPFGGKRLSTAGIEGSTQYTMYANWNSHLTEKLKLNLGIRYSYYNTNANNEVYCDALYGGTSCLGGLYEIGEEYYRSEKIRKYADHNFSWPPSVSLVYSLNKNLSLYGSYSDIYTSQSNLVDTSYESLDPVLGFNTEFGANYLSDSGLLTGKVSLYYIEQTNIGIQTSSDPTYDDPTHGCCFTGGGRQTSYGADIEVAGQLSPGWQISGSYNLNLNKTRYPYPSITFEGALTTQAPKHMLKLWTNYQIDAGPQWLKKVTVGGGVNMSSKTFESGYACAEYDYSIDPVTGQLVGTCIRNELYEFSQGFYSVWSLFAAYKINDNWKVAVNIGNIFDTTYYARTGMASNNWYGEPRSFAVTLSGKF